MKQKILIAEDEADIRNILKLYLEAKGLRWCRHKMESRRCVWRSGKCRI